MSVAENVALSTTAGDAVCPPRTHCIIVVICHYREYECPPIDFLDKVSINSYGSKSGGYVVVCCRLRCVGQRRGWGEEVEHGVPFHPGWKSPV